jgi:dihydroneopterin aldolase
MNAPVIRIRHMRFWGRHGVSEQERESPQEIELDVEVRLGAAASTASDMLEDTIDYRTIYRTCERIVTGRSFALLEALAEACLREIVSDARVAQASLRARKPALLDGATPEVELTRSNSAQ